jgi:hypothetical protein
MQAGIEAALAEGCEEIHLQDSSAMTTCVHESNNLPISLKLFKVFSRGETWYERLGFVVCEDPRPRVAPSYLPWTPSDTSHTRPRSSATNRTLRDYHRSRKFLYEFPMDPWRDFLKSQIQKPSVPASERAQIWAPVYGYLLAFLETHRNEKRFGAFVFWLLEQNCVVYQMFQDLWLDSPADHPIHNASTLDEFLHHVKVILRMPYYRGRCEDILERLKTLDHAPTPALLADPFSINGRIHPHKLVEKTGNRF